MDMQEAVESAMTKLVASGKIEVMIEEKLEETIKGLIDDNLRSYSDFGKALGEMVKQSLKIDPKEISLPEYSTVLGNHVIEIIQKTMIPMAKAAIEENLKKFVKPLEKDQYTLSEIIELLKEDLVEDDSDMEGQHFTCLVSESTRGFVDIALDETPKTEKYKCKYRFGIYQGKVYTVTIDGKDARDVKVPTFHGFADLLFKLYAGGVTIVDDRKDWDPEEISYIPYKD